MIRSRKISAVCSALLILFQGVAAAQGFYGGFSVRPKNLDPGIAQIESNALSWTKPTGDEPSQQARIYGGYRLHSDVGVEAALTHSQRLGLRFDPRSFGLTAGDETSRAWNLDLYTSWALQPKIAVYGRVGIEQPNNPASTSAGTTSDLARRQALGLNYGIGLRYDLNTAMGVRFEWARPYRNANASATASGLNDPNRNDAADQVSVGIQFRF